MTPNQFEGIENVRGNLMDAEADIHVEFQNAQNNFYKTPSQLQ